MHLIFFLFSLLASSQKTHDKFDGVDIEEVCTDRPGDEYFRLDIDGDCREVYRYVVLIPLTKTFNILSEFHEKSLKI